MKFLILKKITYFKTNIILSSGNNTGLYVFNLQLLLDTAPQKFDLRTLNCGNDDNLIFVIAVTKQYYYDFFDIPLNNF